MDLDTLRRVFLLQREGKGGNVKAGPDKPLRGITQTGFDFGLNSRRPKSDYSRGVKISRIARASEDTLFRVDSAIQVCVSGRTMGISQFD